MTDSKSMSFLHHFQKIANSQITFHWSNSSESVTRFLSEGMNQQQCNEFLTIKDLKEQLKQEKIWFKDQQRRPLYFLKLYEQLLQSMFHAKNSYFHQPELYSVHSEIGPFQKAPLSSLINHTEFKTFLYFSLLEGKLPHRSFRVNIENGGVLLQSQDNIFTGLLHEVLMNGLIIKVKKTQLPLLMQQHFNQGLPPFENLALAFSNEVLTDFNKIFENTKKVVTESRQQMSNPATFRENSFIPLDMSLTKISTSFLDHHSCLYLYIPFSGIENDQMQDLLPDFICECIHAFI
jgi:hypothetical protein